MVLTLLPEVTVVPEEVLTALAKAEAVQELQVKVIVVALELQADRTPISLVAAAVARAVLVHLVRQIPLVVTVALVQHHQLLAHL